MAQTIIVKMINFSGIGQCLGIRASDLHAALNMETPFLSWIQENTNEFYLEKDPNEAWLSLDIAKELAIHYTTSDTKILFQLP